MDNKQIKKSVIDILKMPIICKKSITGKAVRRGNVIYSGQKYYGSEDSDMSDIAILFY